MSGQSINIEHEFSSDIMYGMKQTLFISIIFTTQLSLACIDLAGSWSGDCIYASEYYGNLDSSLDIEIKQKSCLQFIFDGRETLVPGAINAEDIFEDGVTQSSLAFHWADQSQSQLNFVSILKTTLNTGKVVDDIYLEGSFKIKGDKLIVEQNGTVDSDKVKISCELKKKYNKK